MARVGIIGTGLIGGSIGLGLVRGGHDVAGFDPDAPRLDRAVEIGAVTTGVADLTACAADRDIVFVAGPVGAVPLLAAAALDGGATVVTDVGSVKAPIVAELATLSASPERFVGGHPMAGSEQEGIDGADADMFVGATWVLTPTATTAPDAFSATQGLVRELGAEVLAVTPEHHDLLVAYVSHVPQLAATMLMDVADRHEDEHRALLRLAAGGFRDMTRIAAGHPGIWPDILTANRRAVLEGLDAYLGALGEVRALVEAGDHARLLAVMERARSARRNLPVGVDPDATLVELRIPVADRPGVLAEVTTLAGRLGVNVADLEIAHSVEGGGGVMVMVVTEAGADGLVAGLVEKGYHTSRRIVS